MTRIVAGALGGRRLLTPRGSTTRPTSERVREALFSRLDAVLGLAGTRVLDLYSGSGALGLEAASRGAAQVVLVEASRPAAALIARNVRELGLGAVCQVRAERVERVLAGPAPERGFDLVLADPPYPLGEDEVAAVLHRLCDGGWATPEGLVVLERSHRSPDPRWPQGWEVHETRRYGDTLVHSATARRDGVDGGRIGP